MHLFKYFRYILTYCILYCVLQFILVSVCIGKDDELSCSCGRCIQGAHGMCVNCYTTCHWRLRTLLPRVISYGSSSDQLVLMNETGRDRSFGTKCRGWAFWGMRRR